MAASPNSNERISWPKRAVVTAGMPYGNKPLHFGHIAGGGGCDKNGLAVMMGHAAAVVGKGFNGEGQDLIFLKGHGCSLYFALYCWACWAAFCSASRAVRYLLGGTFFTFLKTREK